MQICVGVLIKDCRTGACMCVGYMPRLVGSVFELRSHEWPYISRGRLTAEVTGQLQRQ